MVFKKIVLLSLIACLFTASTTRSSTFPEIRTQALAALGVALGIGGIYQLIKRSESNTYRLSDILSGVLLIAAGIGTIIISGQLINEIDQRFK